MVHPACDFARHVMQVSAAGRGVSLSDGATNIMPIPRHRAAAGSSLTTEQMVENRTVVHRAMRLHFEHVQRSLMHGYCQGWDLHPGQLPTRFAAVYSFFLQSFETAAARLRNFVEKAAQATLVGDVFDDAATGQGLLNFFLRGINCGAFTEEEACATGLTLEELRGTIVLENSRQSAWSALALRARHGQVQHAERQEGQRYRYPCQRPQEWLLPHQSRAWSTGQPPGNESTGKPAYVRPKVDARQEAEH